MKPAAKHFKPTTFKQCLNGKDCTVNRILITDAKGVLVDVQEGLSFSDVMKRTVRLYPEITRRPV